MAEQDFPTELGINHLPLVENPLNLVFSSTMLGEKPKFILKDKTKIANILSFLTKVKTNRPISKQFIHFVFKFNKNVIYVDCDGVVYGFSENFIVDSKVLEKYILDLGYPAKSPNNPVPPEWQ